MPHVCSHLAYVMSPAQTSLLPNIRPRFPAARCCSPSMGPVLIAACMMDSYSIAHKDCGVKKESPRFAGEQMCIPNLKVRSALGRAQTGPC
jgi:hypothetical protein